AGRGIDEATVRAVLDRAPLLAPEAREAGLVDRLGYRDEVYAAVRERAGADASLLYVDRYARAAARVRPRRRGRRHIALVHVHGTIHLGRSGRRPLGGATAGAASVCAALRAAAADRNVAAVVLRVDSRGGSYVASDAIWREVAVTRAAGTPVVVSMGDVAASGGYFVAAGADAIVAEPATVTGSIGVVAGKAVVAGLAGRLGIGHEEVAGAARDLMFSPLRPFSDDEWARLDTWLDRIYQDFTAKVAAGRGMPPDRVEEVARGRVWTGAEARERGLVDELGGLARAAEVARARAGLPPAPPPELHTYPRVPAVARLRRPRSSDDPAAAGAAVTWDAWGDLAGIAAKLGLPAEGPLTLPAAWLPA
ncbi:MAG TPA: S49 family peptidase, partial [Acidimicrobiales bacterium]